MQCIEPSHTPCLTLFLSHYSSSHPLSFLPPTLPSPLATLFSPHSCPPFSVPHLEFTPGSILLPDHFCTVHPATHRTQCDLCTNQVSPPLPHSSYPPCGKSGPLWRRLAAVKMGGCAGRFPPSPLLTPPPPLTHKGTHKVHPTLFSPSHLCSHALRSPVHVPGTIDPTPPPSPLPPPLSHARVSKGGSTVQPPIQHVQVQPGPQVSAPPMITTVVNALGLEGVESWVR
jgi:hypothetical protein